MRGELEVVVAAGQAEHDAVVAGVSLEVAELLEPEAVAIEGDDLVEPVGRARHAHAHDGQLGRPAHRGSGLPAASAAAASTPRRM